MKITHISFNEFADSFTGSYGNNFSDEGLQALFAYLEDYEDSVGEELELDPIAFCCEYTEYDSFKELQENYSDIETMEELRDHTAVIEIEGTDRFIIQDY